MITDTELKLNGYKILTENLGEVLTERFIALLQREKFDYTKWQKDLWKNIPVKELSKKAMDYKNNNDIH
ncbi:MAG: hypothetical protein AB1765_05130 [Candidatus Hydrogenedentota bacterium]